MALLARITLTHPPLNVIDFEMMDELLAALQQLEQRREISVVIISGGRARLFRRSGRGGAHAGQDPDHVAEISRRDSVRW